MQMKTGTFGESFSQNTIYRFMNSTKTNWQRFTTLLSAAIICGFMKPLIGDDRKDVFIVDDSLLDEMEDIAFSRSMCVILDVPDGCCNGIFSYNRSPVGGMSNFIQHLPETLGQRELAA